MPDRGEKSRSTKIEAEKVIKSTVKSRFFSRTIFLKTPSFRDLVDGLVSGGLSAGWSLSMPKHFIFCFPFDNKFFYTYEKMGNMFCCVFFV